ATLLIINVEPSHKLKFYQVSRERLNNLLKQDDKEKSAIHVVKCIGQTFYKLASEHQGGDIAAGIEFSVNSLTYLSTLEITATTTIIRLQTKDKVYIFQASKEMPGETLDKAFLPYQNKLQQLPLQNYTAMIVRSLIINPGDDKPKNAVAVKNHDKLM